MHGSRALVAAALQPAFPAGRLVVSVRLVNRLYNCRVQSSRSLM